MYCSTADLTICLSDHVLGRRSGRPITYYYYTQIQQQEYQIQITFCTSLYCIMSTTKWSPRSTSLPLLLLLLQLQPRTPFPPSLSTLPQLYHNNLSIYCQIDVSQWSTDTKIAPRRTPFLRVLAVSKFSSISDDAILGRVIPEFSGFGRSILVQRKLDKVFFSFSLAKFLLL